MHRNSSSSRRVRQRRSLARRIREELPQFDAKNTGTKKMHMLSHVVAHPGAGRRPISSSSRIPDRPYVYLCGFVNFDVLIYDIRNTSAPKKVFEWTIENPELHRGIGAMDGKYFKIGDRYYDAQSISSCRAARHRPRRGDLRRHRAARSSKVKVVARISIRRSPGGFHNTFAYKHSDGRVALLATVNQSKALVYDLAKVVSGAPEARGWSAKCRIRPVSPDRRRRLPRFLCRV